jgi:CBS-domain-containing membrane protein
MSAEVSWCYDDQDCAEAARLMGQKHIRRLAVLDRGEAMAGFLSVDDLARWSHDLAGQVLEAARPVH